MEYTYRGNKLIIGNHTQSFDKEIKEVLDFGDCLVVRTDYFKVDYNENVYGVNIHGMVTWQIKNLDTWTFNGEQRVGIREPYAGIVKLDDKTVRLINLDGTRFEVNPWTGELLSHPLESRIGNRPW